MSEPISIQIALHYQQGSSDKVWAGAVQGTVFHSRWGKRGAALQVGLKDMGTAAAARKQYDAKVKEKIGEGYVPVPFDDSRYGVPSFGAGGQPVAVTGAGADPKPVKFVCSHVLGLDQAELKPIMANERFGVSEKVDGHRRMLEHDPRLGTFTGYNRRGQALPSGVPQSALPLAATGRQFVIDGEAMLEEAVTGRYVAFDLLELDYRDLRQQPFSQRLAALRDLFSTVDHVETTGYVGRVDQTGGLVLLSVETVKTAKQALYVQVAMAGGEGIIVRDMQGIYQTGDTKLVRKLKFRADMDCEILYVKPGVGTGSVGLGLTRPADGVIIELGTARSGLTDSDMRQLAQMLDAGQRPVIKVSYLPIRTTGIALVEPTLYMRDLRSDKLAVECTTDQFGPDKQPLVQQARAWSVSNHLQIRS